MNAYGFLGITAFSFGLFFLLCHILHVPAMAQTRAAIQITKQGESKNGIAAVSYLLSARLSEKLKLSDTRRKDLSDSLRFAGLNLTPELFLSRIAVSFLLRAALAVPAFLIMKLLALPILYWAANRALLEYRKPLEAGKKKRDKIDNELPRFVETIAQQLRATRDVKAILNGYQPNAGTGLKEELSITVADMQSGSQEAALSRFDMRVGSPMLSEVTRGLLGVIRGDDGSIYFSMLSHTFEMLARQKLQAEAEKRPPKMRKYSYLFLFCLLLIFLVPMMIVMGQLMTQMMM